VVLKHRDNFKSALSLAGKIRKTIKHRTHMNLGRGYSEYTDKKQE
jgi:hypothetical protein